MSRPWERVALAEGETPLPADPALSDRLMASLGGFWDYLVARQSLTLRREAGYPREAWTDDPILQRYRFLNVYREQDRVTRVITDWLLPQLIDDRAQVLNVIAARHFNREEAIRALLPVRGLARISEDQQGTAVEARFGADLRALPFHPYTTAYRTTVFVNLGSLSQRENTLTALRGWTEHVPGITALLHAEAGMELTWAWLKRLPGIGPFVAYMIACDLTYTGLGHYDLNGNGFTYPHVGSRRALARAMGLEADEVHVRDAQRLCRTVWRLTNPALRTRGFAFWAHCPSGPELTLRHVEDGLCEWHRYLKAQAGETQRLRRFAPHQDT